MHTYSNVAPGFGPDQTLNCLQLESSQVLAIIEIDVKVKHSNPRGSISWLYWVLGCWNAGFDFLWYSNSILILPWAAYPGSSYYLVANGPRVWKAGESSEIGRRPRRHPVLFEITLWTPGSCLLPNEGVVRYFEDMHTPDVQDIIYKYYLLTHLNASWRQWSAGLLVTCSAWLRSRNAQEATILLNRACMRCLF